MAGSAGRGVAALQLPHLLLLLPAAAVGPAAGT